MDAPNSNQNVNNGNETQGHRPMDRGYVYVAAALSLMVFLTKESAELMALSFVALVLLFYSLHAGWMSGLLRLAFAVVRRLWNWWKQRAVQPMDESQLQLYDLYIGQDIHSGEKIVINLAELGHALVSGVTGHGKTTWMYSLIDQMIRRHRPEELKLVIVDGKDGVDYSFYGRLAHLLPNCPIARTAEGTEQALNMVLAETQRRAQRFAILGREHLCNNLERYHELIADYPHLGFKRFPRLVVIVDEVSIIIKENSAAEQKLLDLVRTSRAYGINIILSTQRATVAALNSDVQSQLITNVVFRMRTNGDYGRIAQVPKEVYEQMQPDKGNFIFYHSSTGWRHLHHHKLSIQHIEEGAASHSFDNEPQWPETAAASTTSDGAKSLSDFPPEDRERLVLEWFIELAERPSYDQFRAKWHCTQGTAARYLKHLNLWEESRRIRTSDQ